MKAFILERFGEQPRLRDDVPQPMPADGEVLVRVEASSVNPMDGGIVVGMMRERVEHVFPITLGRDFAGVVEAVGGGVSRFSPGDAVFGFIPGMDPTIHTGTWAELISVPEARLAVRPRKVDVAQAGAAGLVGATALAGIDALELAPGQTVLIVGATGGVGGVATQLAVSAGAQVVAPARPEDEDYLRGVGVAQLVPRGDDVTAAVLELHPDGVDAVFDLVSFTPGGFDGALKAGGRIASPLGAAGEGLGRTNVAGLPTPETLRRLSDLLRTGTIAVPIQATYSLDDAGEGLRAFAALPRHGKIALSLTGAALVSEPSREETWTSR